MNARAVLARASASGVNVSARDGKVALRGQARAVEELRPQVQACKRDLLALLAMPPELDDLIVRVAAFHGFTAEQITEAREVAVGDVGNALICFRALASRLG